MYCPLLVGHSNRCHCRSTPALGRGILVWRTRRDQFLSWAVERKKQRVQDDVDFISCKRNVVNSLELFENSGCDIRHAIVQKFRRLHHIDWLVVRFVRYFQFSGMPEADTHNYTSAAEIVSSRTHITDYAYTTSYVHSGVCLRMPFSFRCCELLSWHLMYYFICHLTMCIVYTYQSYHPPIRSCS